MHYLAAPEPARLLPRTYHYSVYNDRSRFLPAPVYVVAGTRIGLANCTLGGNQYAGRSGSSSPHGWPGAPPSSDVASGGRDVLYSLRPRVDGWAGPEPNERHGADTGSSTWQCRRVRGLGAPVRWRRASPRLPPDTLPAGRAGHLPGSLSQSLPEHQQLPF